VTARGAGRRRVVALGLGVALPTVLLAAGWLLASLRERAGLVREHEAVRRQAAERIAAAVAEGLEELRRREDARPFYLYNHFYSPPEVLAVGDAVAVSPLAADPDDPRVLGHFQVDPGEKVRTPYPVDDGDPGPPRARRVAEIAGSPAFAPLRALSFGEPAVPPDRRLAMNDAPPLTTNLGNLSNEVYRDLAQARTGDEQAGRRVQRRQVPVTSRKQVSWEAIQSQQALNVPQVQAASAAPVFEQLARQTSNYDEPTPRSASPPPQSPDPPPAPAGPPEPQAPAIPPQPPAPPAPVPAPARPRPRPAPRPDLSSATGPRAHVPTDMSESPAAFPPGAEVDYTPMAYLALGDRLVLQRVVSHAGTGSVQGVLLDRDYLLRTWLPAVVERHAPGGARVIAAGDECPAAFPVSEHLPDARLCFPAAAPPPDPLAYQAGALLGLIAVVGIGVVVVARAARRADELSAQKTAFVSAVSHELRTPLTTLRMHAELLQEGLVAPASLATFYDDLVRESVRLSRLVENVLAVSQLEEGRRVIQPRPGDLAAHVRDVLAGQARHVASKGFPAIVLELPDDPVVVRFDAQAIDQILVNLLDNALKYAAEAADAGVRVRLERAHGRAVLHVEDRGPGIPEAERERVFERFVRVQRPSAAHTPGTGLGLSLVRDLARAHGGDAQVLARVGGGADFQVWLPCDDRE
jgi:signal transduction histidine kinase